MALYRTPEDPIGMGAIEVAVGVDHLRLNPEAKLHTPATAHDRSGGLGPEEIQSHPQTSHPAPHCRIGDC